MSVVRGRKVSALHSTCKLMYDPPSPRTRAARALRPPSWYTARSARVSSTADAPDTDISANAPRTYLTRLAQPFDDPYEYVAHPSITL